MHSSVRPRRLLLFVLLLPLSVGRATAQRIDELDLAPGSGPAGLAVGPDGNIWFAEEAGNRIGRLNPAGPTVGSPTEYSLPNPDSRPHGVTAASDGILFTEGDGRIGGITAGGLLSEFVVPGGAPREIATGPFAQFWWSDPSHDVLRSIDELGRSFFADSLAGGARPEGVATGASGDLWFAENGAGRIGRLYRQPPPPGIPSVGSLQRQEFSLPDATSGPWGIAFGPDGNVWFTDAARDLIVRMAPDGSMRAFPLPTRGSRPMYLVATPDGNIWFSEPGTDRIGRLAIPPFCSPNATILCLGGGRFQAAVSYFFSSGPYAGTARAVPLTADAGAFWIFSPNNLELVVKVVDGRAINGKFWVFAGSLTDGVWLLEIRDTETGRIRRYQSTEGEIRSLGDTDAF